jgi:hypothetical protein
VSRVGGGGGENPPKGHEEECKCGV